MTGRRRSPAAVGVAACESRCGTQIRSLVSVDGSRIVVDAVADPAGDVVLAREVAYPLDSSGRYQGKEPKPGAARYGRHRCPVAAALARNRALINAGSQVGPCARCRLPCTRYGPNGRPLCPECQPGPAPG